MLGVWIKQRQMIKARKWIIWPIGCLSLICCLVIGSSLWLFDEPFGWILFLRGPECYRIDFKETVGGKEGFEKLHAECASLVTTLDGSHYDLNVPTNLPPVLAALRPQSITLEYDPLCVNIQVSGGFFHRGLLVKVNPEDKAVPSMTWIRGQIAPGIYEWKE
jgi:hypothetical protein